MDHDEASLLLGAYALDAVEPEEAAEIEAHLATCPRCRVELAAHRKVVALLGNSAEAAPSGLWERLVESMGAGAETAPDPDALIARLPRAPRPPRWRRVAIGGLAAAVAAIATLSVEVANPSSPTTSGGLESAVAAALAGPHQVVALASPQGSSHAQVVLTADDEAYWTSSSLPRLVGQRTYQLWALSDGRVVSLGLIGSDATRDAVFRVAPGMTKLMVTAEPGDGSVAPTPPVLVEGALPTTL